MKPTKFKKFPCRFQSEEASDLEELLNTSGSPEFSVSDIWVDLFKISAFSEHTVKGCTWATLDNGLNLALEISIKDFIDIIKDDLEIEAVEPEAEEEEITIQFIPEGLLDLLPESTTDEKEAEGPIEDDGPEEIDPEE